MSAVCVCVCVCCRGCRRCRLPPSPLTAPCPLCLGLARRQGAGSNAGGDDGCGCGGGQPPRRRGVETVGTRTRANPTCGRCHAALDACVRAGRASQGAPAGLQRAPQPPLCPVPFGPRLLQCARVKSAGVHVRPLCACALPSRYTYVCATRTEIESSACVPAAPYKQRTPLTYNVRPPISRSG